MNGFLSGSGNLGSMQCRLDRSGPPSLYCLSSPQQLTQAARAARQRAPFLVGVRRAFAAAASRRGGWAVGWGGGSLAVWQGIPSRRAIAPPTAIIPIATDAADTTIAITTGIMSDRLVASNRLVRCREA